MDKRIKAISKVMETLSPAELKVFNKITEPFANLIEEGYDNKTDADVLKVLLAVMVYFKQFRDTAVKIKKIK